MKVKLLKHVIEGTGIKMAKKKNKDWTPPKVVKEDGNEKIVECGLPEHLITPFVEGTVIECSDATAQKWVEQGLAEIYTAPAEETAPGQDEKAAGKKKGTKV